MNVLQILRARAELLRQIRVFFDERDVLEVTTPILSQAGATDPNIPSLSTLLCSTSGNTKYYLHTSPEFAMKRLLAFESGSLFQICQVFRDSEQGRHHQPEFSMLEWYRVGWDHKLLMEEVQALLKTCLPGKFFARPIQYLSYRQAFLNQTGLDPFFTTVAECQAYCAGQQHIYPEGMSEDLDEWLDLILSHFVIPHFASSRLIFLYDYPASQAALAKLRVDKDSGITVAERFEVFAGSIELANGFNELTDPAEQLRRFQSDNNKRARQGKTLIPVDMHLIGALERGLPACAGVALGLDRLLMLMMGVNHIQKVMALPFEP